MNDNSYLYIKNSIIKSLEISEINEIIENANKLVKIEFSFINVENEWRNFLKEV